jgi:hypothetical protein
MLTVAILQMTNRGEPQRRREHRGHRGGKRK